MRPETAARAAGRAARFAAEAAELAEREEASARFTEKITHVGSAVAREFTLPAILDVVLDQTIRTLEAHCAHVYLADESQRALKLVGQRNIPQDLVETMSKVGFDDGQLVARAASSRRAQVIPSIDELAPELHATRELMVRTGCQSGVALPLLARDQLVGVLSFGLADPHEFTWEERVALDNCAEIFSFGIANAAIYEEEHRLRALFEAVNRATVTIASELELTPVLQHIVDEAREVVDAEYAALGIAVSADRPFDPWVFSGMTREQAALIGRLPRPIGTLAAVVSERRAVRVDDVRRHPAFQGFPAHHPTITSFLGVPIHHDGRCVGNLYLANKRGAAGFSLADEQAVEILAGHAAAAVRQANLRDQIGRERARFRAIVESAPHGVLFIEWATMKLIANRRAIELTGQPLPTVTAEKVEYQGQMCSPDGKTIPEEDQPARRVMRGETVLPHELLLRRPDGTEVPVLISASRVLDGGRTDGVVVVFEDISVLKELQQLREEWAAVVTHDLRQPLNAMTMHLSLLQRMAAHPNPQKLLKMAETMQRAARTLSRMIGDLADVSRIETRRLTLERQPVDLEALARDLVERLQLQEPERVIALGVVGSIPKVDVDPVRIEQVLGNLVANAVKYSEPGTAVAIEIRVEANEARVLVINQGPGVSAEELPKLFDRYYRTDRARAGAGGGLGLGLYIAKGLIEAHGGRIWCESTPGRTTTFQFALPVAPLT